MVFQCYYSAAVAFVSFVIWAVAGSSAGLYFTTSSVLMGILFGVLWITSQIFAFNGIQALGYAVVPAIWVGISICMSFFWGVTAFGNPVRSWPGAILALLLLVGGVCL